jgi:hypothetical protein
MMHAWVAAGASSSVVMQVFDRHIFTRLFLLLLLYCSLKLPPVPTPLSVSPPKHICAGPGDEPLLL